jgi:hypothetical protein
MKQQEQEARGKRPGVVVAAGGGKKEGRRGAPPCAAPLSLVSSIIQEYQLAAVMRLSGDRKGKALSRQMVFSSLQARPGQLAHSIPRVKGSTRGSCSVASFLPVHRQEVHITLPVPAQLAQVSPAVAPLPTQVPQVR